MRMRFVFLWLFNYFIFTPSRVNTSEERSRRFSSDNGSNGNIRVFFGRKGFPTVVAVRSHPDISCPLTCLAYETMKSEISKIMSSTFITSNEESTSAAKKKRRKVRIDATTYKTKQVTSRYIYLLSYIKISKLTIEN